MLIELSKIRRDGGTQPRAYTDPETVEDYASAMERGKKFHPVDVVFDGAEYWLVDGFHRIGAAERNGLESFECEVHQGTLDDAKWMSLAANSENGKQRSRDDLHRAIAAAFRHPLGVGQSDHAIAIHIDCDPKTVGAARKRLEATGEIPQSATRKGLDGKLRTVAPTKSTPLPEPDEKIQAPDGGWPEPDEDGTYSTELAEPIFENYKHAQAVIHVLEVEPMGWKGNVRRWIANAQLTGVSGCDLATPLDVDDDERTRDEAIHMAAHWLLVHLLRCYQVEGLLASRRAALEHFIGWAELQGADRVRATEELERERKQAELQFVRDAEELVFAMVSLVDPRPDRLRTGDYDWPKLVAAMVGFAETDDVEGSEEMRALIANIDEVSAHFGLIAGGIREYIARKAA